MTPDIQQGRDDYPRSQPPRPDSGAAVHPAARPGPPSATVPHGGLRQAPQDRSIVWFVPYLAVLLCAVVGVFIAWRDGSAGGGVGGAVLGAALLAAAVARLLLPARLMGLLATRKRATDVLTLAGFGVGLLVAGLVLPR